MLGSLGRGLLTLPEAHLKTKGDGAFTVRAPRLWIDLPEEIGSAQSVISFKLLLKTYFFWIAFPDFLFFFNLNFLNVFALLLLFYGFMTYSAVTWIHFVI